MAIVRAERPEDAAQIRQVNELAFGQPAEADLVDRLREACPEAFSWVADDGGAIVGHILFTPVVAEGRRARGMGLAPLAVRPDYQRKGIGSQLVRRGVDDLRERGYSFVVVVGHPEYYPRFGFEPASRHGLLSQWEGMPDTTFMALVLAGHTIVGAPGVARYRDEFNEVR